MLNLNKSILITKILHLYAPLALVCRSTAKSRVTNIKAEFPPLKGSKFVTLFYS